MARYVHELLIYPSYNIRDLQGHGASKELAKQLKQKVGEIVPIGLLQLWNDGADNMKLNPQGMSQIAIIPAPSLCAGFCRIDREHP